mgnify:FL=1
MLGYDNFSLFTFHFSLFTNLIAATNIHKKFGQVEILKGVDIHVEKAQVVSIVGASGAGKTTLLHILGTLDTMTEAEGSSLIINGIDVKKLSAKKLAQFRNEHIGFIFQFHQLLPEFTALENVCIPAFIKGTSRQAAERRGKELLDYLGLSHRLSHKPDALSGGEQQRVAVARALMNQPAVIFADEPSGNLDSESAQQLHQLFFSLRDAFAQTFVIVTHNTQLAQMADKTFTMQDGRLMTSD